MNSSDIIQVVEEAVAISDLTKRKGFRQVLEYLAVRLDIDAQLPLKMSLDVYRYLDSHIDAIVSSPEWAREKLSDPLGQLAETWNLIPSQISLEALPAYVKDLELPASSNMPPLILDRACGVGRRLIAAHRRFGHQAVYAGCERDTYSYRIATINMFLYGVSPVRILWTKHAYINSNLGSHDWGWAGQWILPKNAVLQQRYTHQTSE